MYLGFRELSIWSSGDYYFFGVQKILLGVQGLLIWCSVWCSGDYLFGVQEGGGVQFVEAGI